MVEIIFGQLASSQQQIFIMNKCSKNAELLKGLPKIIAGIFIIFLCIHASKGKYGVEAIFVRSLLATVGFTIVMGMLVLFFRGLNKLLNINQTDDSRNENQNADEGLERPIPRKFSFRDIIDWKYLLVAFVILAIAYFALYSEYTFTAAITQSAIYCGWVLIGCFAFYLIGWIYQSCIRKKEK